MHVLRTLGLGLTALVFSTLTSAATVSLSGELTPSDPRFSRPLNGIAPTALSTTGSNVRYDAVPFYVTANDNYTLETHTANFDTFLVLYRDVFNPLAPLTNVMAADDDSGVGLLSRLTMALNTGVQYIAVFTSFENGERGSYTASISNAGAGTAMRGTVQQQVPTPGTLALVALGLVAAATTLRRKPQA